MLDPYSGKLVRRLVTDEDMAPLLRTFFASLASTWICDCDGDFSASF